MASLFDMSIFALFDIVGKYLPSYVTIPGGTTLFACVALRIALFSALLVWLCFQPEMGVTVKTLLPASVKSSYYTYGFTDECSVPTQPV